MKYFTSVDYSFPMQISEQCYETKPTKEQIAQMKFSPVTVSCTTLADYIQSGYAYCPTERKLDEVNECYAICIDVDDSTIPMENYVENLSDTPSLYYTTPSNGNVQKSIEKYGDEYHIYRFRLVYVLATPTSDNYDFDKVYQYITSTNQMEDVDVRKANQYYNGSFGCSITNTNYIYQLPSDINDLLVDRQHNISNISNKNTTETAGSSQYIYIPPNNTICDDPLSKTNLIDFRRDLYRLPPSKFITRYRHIYELYNSNIDEYLSSDGYYLLDKDFIELKRQWKMENVPTSSGSKMKIRPVIRKDGQHRRITLYNTARLFLKMKDISLEHLILLMVNERTYYYDNSDDVLSNRWLVQMCKDVFRTKDDDRMRVPDNEKQFKVDKAYWQRKGITVKQAVPKIRKELNYKRIDELYDSSKDLTTKEWVQYLSDNGVKVSDSTFKRYKRERGYTKKHRKIQPQNPNKIPHINT